MHYDMLLLCTRGFRNEHCIYMYVVFSIVFVYFSFVLMLFKNAH